ncbi:FkbM family methyltransferase [Candidatus Pelagibacter ubique]|jgi:FkbM family methyltransferase|nr:FkbM family methyltransferase [Candidatus Pelagibacter ubique]
MKFIKFKNYKNRLAYYFKSFYKKNFRKFNGLKNVDEKMLQYLNFNNGYFIEIGAHDGIKNSNTLFYEKNKNWHGLLVEPSRYFRFLIKNRSKRNKFFNCGCTKFNHIAQTNLKGSGDFSICVDLVDKKFYERSLQKQSISKLNITTNKIKLRTLNSILLEAKSPDLVDFFSLDVEGMELNVLKGVDFNRFNFRYLLVECTNPQRKKMINDFLEKKNYQYIDNLTPWDVLFKYQK